MDIFIAVVVLAILAQTSYLLLTDRRKSRPARDALIMDTSALIDGRIVAIARSGLVSAQLIVPKSVIGELQFMADKADHDKRERARFGLEVIETLQALDGVTLEVLDDSKPAEREVDEQLLQLSQKYGARLCTIDYNLNKAARVQKVQVVNINELAHALRIVHLPGEQTIVKIVQPGQESRQGVGYLDDGTMVVVDEAKGRINEEVEVTITRVLQTAAGKMMFAKLTAASRIADEHKGQAPRAKKGEAKSRNPRQKGGWTGKARMSPQARAESKLVELANQDDQ